MSEYSDYAWGVDNVKRDLQSFGLGLAASLTPAIAVQRFKELIKAKSDAELVPANDEVILRFLYARRMDPDEAFDSFVKYSRLTIEHPALYDKNNVNDDEVRQAIEDGLPGVLDRTDRKGRHILVLFAAQWDESRYTILAIHKALVLTLESLLNQANVQEKGLVMVVDWTGFTFRQCSKLEVSTLRLIVESIEYGFPIRFKAVHCVGQSWYVEVAMTLLKPFLRMGTRDRIHYHGTNLSTLHEFLPKEILPDELGGEHGPYQASWWLGKLAEKATNA